MPSKPQCSALITDLDNTLFDWFDIWSATFIPMLNKTIEITQLPREQLIQEIKAIHEKHGTAEYAFVLQELPSLLKIYNTPKKIMEELEPAIHVARSNRLKHLKLYPGVYDTLSELRCKRIKIIAYTESKQWYTKYRLKRLGLDHFIDHVYSPQDHELVPIRKGERSHFSFDHTEFSHTPQGELKPNPDILLSVIEEQKLQKEDCIYVGDSEMKDINMAQDANVLSVFARYGSTHFDERKDDYELLRKVTHWTKEDVERERTIKDNAIHHDADFVIDSFPEILELIDFKR